MTTSRTASRTQLRASTHWWQDALVYQVYVRSFADSTGDGVGDLNGIRAHLDHIAALGVDAIWLNPCYPSPQKDHGYDVSDYFDIHDEYGALETFDALVADAAGRGIKTLMDVVPNHCSSRHQWFLDALAAAPGSPERARFYFRDGKGTDGTEPPNNWQATFGGSAWTRANDRADDGQWYLGTFTPHQPDFDQTNADVQAMFADVLRFWFDRGVEGFRVDAITPVGKHPDLPDQPPVGPEVGTLDITWVNPYTVFREEGHDVWRRWRTVIDEYGAAHPGRDLMMVAEAYATRRPELTRAFTRQDEFHQMFAFDLMLTPWHKESVERALGDIIGIVDETGVAPAWTLNNHDTQRIVTRARPAGGRRSRQLDGQQPEHHRQRRRPRPGRTARPCAHRAGVRGAREPLPLPGRGARTPRGVRHPRRPPRRPRVPPHQRRGTRAATAVGSRSPGRTIRRRRSASRAVP